MRKYSFCAEVKHLFGSKMCTFISYSLKYTSLIYTAYLRTSTETK